MRRDYSCLKFARSKEILQITYPRQGTHWHGRDQKTRVLLRIWHLTTVILMKLKYWMNTLHKGAVSYFSRPYGNWSNVAIKLSKLNTEVSNGGMDIRFPRLPLIYELAPRSPSHTLQFIGNLPTDYDSPSLIQSYLYFSQYVAVGSYTIQVSQLWAIMATASRLSICSQNLNRTYLNLAITNL